jgi:hypothetical protein
LPIFLSVSISRIFVVSGGFSTNFPSDASTKRSKNDSVDKYQQQDGYLRTILSVYRWEIGASASSVCVSHTRFSRTDTIINWHNQYSRDTSASYLVLTLSNGYDSYPLGVLPLGLQSLGLQCSQLELRGFAGVTTRIPLNVTRIPPKRYTYTPKSLHVYPPHI